MKMVEIVWEDASGPPDEQTLTEEEVRSLRPLTMHDLGYEVERNDKYTTLVGQISEVGGHRRIITIPRVGIKRRRVLG